MTTTRTAARPSLLQEVPGATAPFRVVEVLTTGTPIAVADRSGPVGAAGSSCTTYRRGMTLPELATADITSLIMDDHEWLRRQFAALDDARTPAELSAVWDPLAQRLDTHAQCEEETFYPALLQHGSERTSDEETDDAIGDHNDIREAVAQAGEHEVGSHEWYEAVGRARAANSEHLTEEEDEGLPNFRKNAPRELRAELAQRWIAFYAAHPHGKGIDDSPRDPAAYIEQNS